MLSVVKTQKSSVAVYVGVGSIGLILFCWIMKPPAEDCPPETDRTELRITLDADASVAVSDAIFNPAFNQP